MAGFVKIDHAGGNYAFNTTTLACILDSKPGKQTMLYLDDGGAIVVKEPIAALLGRIQAADPALKLVQLKDDKGKECYVNPALVGSVQERKKSTYLRFVGVSGTMVTVAQTLPEVIQRLANA